MNDILDLDSISAEEWDEFFRQIEIERQAKKLRKDNPYALDIIRVLRGRENGLSRQMALHFILKNRGRLKLNIPRTFENTVQQACERFCVDSDVFRAHGAEDENGLFCWPKGAGAGHWAIRQPQADNWLRAFVVGRRRASI
jgi:hypothetical protein